MNCLAVIPARSGSKGVKDKNIVLIQGKPLLAYTIEAAKESKCFSKVMVSTDSEKYAEIAEQYGAEVPFLRSLETATDQAGSWDVVIEVLAEYAKQGWTFDKVALLQPTSPLRKAEDIKSAIALMERLEAENVVSVTEVNHPVEWSFLLPENLSMYEFGKSPFSRMRRQDLPKHYQENGAIFLVDADKIRTEGYNFYRDNCVAYIMPREDSVDIDDDMDILVLKSILKWREENGNPKSN